MSHVVSSEMGHISTYSASHRVNGSSHPLDGWLRGYSWGPVPRVLWAAGYGPKNLDATQLPLVAYV
jgi:hypothetical protein